MATMNRRQFLKLTATGMLGLYVSSKLGPAKLVYAKPVNQKTNAMVSPLATATLNPVSIPKYQTPMLIPPAMPRAGTIKQMGGPNVDYYEISMKQFPQQILPAGYPATAVWGYGAVTADSKRGLLPVSYTHLTLPTTPYV